MEQKVNKARICINKEDIIVVVNSTPKIDKRLRVIVDNGNKIIRLQDMLRLYQLSIEGLIEFDESFKNKYNSLNVDAKVEDIFAFKQGFCVQDSKKNPHNFNISRVRNEFNNTSCRSLFNFDEGRVDVRKLQQITIPNIKPDEIICLPSTIIELCGPADLANAKYLVKLRAWNTVYWEAALRIFIIGREDK